MELSPCLHEEIIPRAATLKGILVCPSGMIFCLHLCFCRGWYHDRQWWPAFRQQRLVFNLAPRDGFGSAGLGDSRGHASLIVSFSGGSNSCTTRPVRPTELGFSCIYVNFFASQRRCYGRLAGSTPAFDGYLTVGS